MRKKRKAKVTGAAGKKPKALSEPRGSSGERKISRRGFLGVIGVILTIVFGVCGYWQARSAATRKGQEKAERDLKELKEGQERTLLTLTALVDNTTKANSPELADRFPGGFFAFGVMLGGSVTAGHNIIRGSAADSFDITWDSVIVSDLTPSDLTMELQNVKIKRTQMTPAGAEPGGAFVQNGKAIWKIDRRTKLVSVNNAINLWGYVIGGCVLSDENGMLIVAVGLQKVE